MRISVYGSKELQAVILGLKAMDRDTAKALRAASKKSITPIWQESVRGNTTGLQEVHILSDTARVSVSDQNVMLTSATVGKTRSGGAKPYQLAHSVEFGADRSFTRSYEARSRKGKSFVVHNRHTRAQFRNRNLKGYVVYPAAADAIPRIAALWVQTVVRGFWDKLEGK